MKKLRSGVRLTECARVKNHAGWLPVGRRGLASGIVWGLFLLTGIAGLSHPLMDGWQGIEERDPRWAILVSGISGDPDLQKQYLKEIIDLRALLEGQLGFPGSQIYVLFDDPALDAARIQYKSTRENLEKVCKEIASRAGREDLVFVFLEGHGDYNANEYRFNMVGPDPTGEELAAMIYSIPAERHIIVNGTNCSGGGLEAMAGRGKVVVTATRSGNEKNQTRLAPYFIEAIADNNADVDKNGRVSVFEAFQYASSRVEEYYTKEGSLQTEHPMLSDNGDAKGIAAPDTDARSALLSRTAYLDLGSALITADMSPEEKALARESQSLEKEIDLLKSAKDEMTEAEYEKRLEELLLKLAKVQLQLRKKQG